jgi:aminopeptidase N
MGNSPGIRLVSLLGLFSVLVLTLMAISVQALAGAVTPRAPLPQGSPWTIQYETRQFLVNEAETKARRMAKKARLDAAGMMNATPNMALYDVHFYDLVMDLDPTSQVLNGNAAVTFEVTGIQLSTLDLNLDNNMSVWQVKSGGQVVTASHAGDILTTTLDRTYLLGEQVTVVIDYFGNPEGDYFGWALYGGKPLIWTLSEPYGAREWWPCKDLNTDKADSVNITVTVPDNLIVACNGLLVAETTPEPGKKTFAWQERYPIATYLVSMTAHPYTVLHDEYHSALGDTMPLDYFIVPDRYEQAMGYAVVPDMITGFAGGFGEYPFLDEKYGHVHFPWGGGMEHQTLTSLHYDAYGQGIIAHELAHQWFGDLVTCADFGHIWLNEGFATWSEAYWREMAEGVPEYHDEMAQARFLGPGTIFVENPGNFWTIFDYDLVYQKASWVPHMLRHMLGDDDFFPALRQYLDTYGHGSATTEQFQAVMEDVSGLDLTAFFQQWIYSDYYPVYDFSWNSQPSGAGHQVSVRVEQVQTLGGLFSMPLDVVVQTEGGGPVTFVIDNSEEVQWYSFQVDDPVTAVALDPDHWVLREVNDQGVSQVRDDVPDVTRLVGIVPNPFNPATEIRFTLPADQAVRLAVYDVSGRLVKTLVDEVRPAGDNGARWDGTDRSGQAVASGAYFARLTGKGVNQVRSMALIR